MELNMSQYITPAHLSVHPSSSAKITVLIKVMPVLSHYMKYDKTKL
jgi:hypothetical protein